MEPEIIALFCIWSIAAPLLWLGIIFTLNR